MGIPGGYGGEYSKKFGHLLRVHIFRPHGHRHAARLNLRVLQPFPRHSDPRRHHGVLCFDLQIHYTTVKFEFKRSSDENS